jgi:hypothetical protein
MSKKTTALAALTCAMVIVIGGFYAQAKPAKGAVTAPAVQCKKDQDCVAVPDDCCSCTTGGRMRALPRKEKASYDKGRKKECQGIMCTEVMSQDPSCSQTPVCDAGVCKMGGGGAKP